MGAVRARLAGASLRRLSGVSAGVFPGGPEHAVYNNALMDRDLGPTEHAVAVAAAEDSYRSAGVGRYAMWVRRS